jgi:hypothetical protein
MVSLLPTKFHEILFSSFRGVALTNCVTDRQTDGQDKNNMSPHQSGGRHNVHVDQMQFIEKTPYDKIHNKFCKFIFGIKKCSSNFSARYELVRYPIDNFIKTQSLLYEDRLLAVDTPEILKECFSLSKSLHEKGICSWYSYINHVRTKNKMDLGNQDMKKNSCKKYYKNILNKDYEEIFDNKLKSIDNNSKLFLFKALKSKNKSEF